MRCLVLLSLLGWIYCAPVDKNVIQLVKRAQETIMYGNQQNGPLSKVKKSGDTKPVEMDIGGSIKALPPVDIEPQKEDEQIVETPVSETIGEYTDDAPEQEVGDASTADQPAVVDEGTSEDTVSPSLETDDGSLTGDVDAEKSPIDNPDPTLDQQIEAYLKPEPEYNDESDAIRTYMQILKTAEDFYNPNQGKQLYDGYSLYPAYKRLRRSYGTHLGQGIKRSHRIKRDLLGPEEERLLLDYLEPAEEAYQVYEPYPTQNEVDVNLLRQYLDLVGSSKYDTGNEVYPEESNYNMPEEVEPLTYNGEPGYFVPMKRQAGLTFVPGIKRDQYFYPSYEEPYTHMGAFTGKRDYNNYARNYEQLMQLAKDLVMSGKDEDYDPYETLEYGYRK